MESRNFQITLVSADNVPNVRHSGKMKVYAEVSINGETETSKKTNVDMVGETNPRWDFPLDFTIAESAIGEEGSDVEVVVKLYCERTLGDKFIGRVKIPLKGLFDSGIKAVNELSYDVEETKDARLNISYSFGDMFVAGPEVAETEDASHDILNGLRDMLVAAEVAAETEDASHNILNGLRDMLVAAAEEAETEAETEDASDDISNSLRDALATVEAVDWGKVVKVGVEVGMTVMEVAEALMEQ